MMKERQRQNRMGRASLVPHEKREQNNSGANERRLRQPDLSLTEIDERPHQTTASGAGEKRARKIESADAMSDALAHSGDHEESSYNSNRHVDQESPAPGDMCHNQCSEKWSGDTRDGPGAGGRAQRPAAFVRRVNNTEQNKRKSRYGSGSDALDGASGNKLHHRARDGAEPAANGERDNADEIGAAASPSIGPRSPDRHRYRGGEHVSRKCPCVELRTAKLGQCHRHHRADDRVVETGKNDREQHTEEDQHAALSRGIHL